MSPYRERPSVPTRARWWHHRAARTVGAIVVAAGVVVCAVALARQCTSPPMTPSPTPRRARDAALDASAPPLDAGALASRAPPPPSDLPDAPPEYPPPSTASIIESLRTALREWISPEARAALDQIDTGALRDDAATTVVYLVVDRATRVWTAEILATAAYDGRASAALRDAAERRLAALGPVHDARSLAAALAALRAAREIATRERDRVDEDSRALMAGMGEPYAATAWFADQAVELVESAQALLAALPRSRRRATSPAATALDASAPDGGPGAIRADLAALRLTRVAPMADEPADGGAPQGPVASVFALRASAVLHHLAWLSESGMQRDPAPRDGQLVALALLADLVDAARGRESIATVNPPDAAAR